MTSTITENCPHVNHNDEHHQIQTFIWLNNTFKAQAHNACINVIQSHIDDLVQDCSNSIANAMELLQSSAQPSKYGDARISHNGGNNYDMSSEAD